LINTCKQKNGKKGGLMANTRGHVIVREDECKGCELCVEACPVNVLVMSPKLNKMGYHPSSYTGDGCTGCGICFYTCPEPGALTVFKRWDLLDAEERNEATHAIEDGQRVKVS
jgi:2-oxoglutarate ferredoxin oxidoreductase subunit delta